jgi:hypothetical protein
MPNDGINTGSMKNIEREMSGIVYQVAIKFVWGRFGENQS